ncbi:M15 family metallopeptidase [Cyanobium sp. NIES-981]|uniref:M15 family metallopeptidase n=1 Tax=Cyanobium sp. NIES-981 TaxID=1851505 RepID=UPI0007DDEB74|nr:M15 family metallopeptidase [Cyanobium sp. NIES-981]SBO42336.1 D-alanyl-D-alanine dipeptidase [Cyanobium sp. NIES-981]
MERRPWNAIPISPCPEPLVPLPEDLWRLEPHPYIAAGAPYGGGGSPFQLRQGVVARLLAAQLALRRQRPSWRLAIFDGWRPLAVQAFMVRHATAELCRQRGLDPHRPGPALEAVAREVGGFWAPPNPDPAAPPPHSTGAAVDLTLADERGAPISMGSPIDAIGEVSAPDHFQRLAAGSLDPVERERAQVFHGRRQLLQAVMQEAGFAQHPAEWWHFSWGDQLWAWRSGQPQAIYGRVEP